MIGCIGYKNYQYFLQFSLHSCLWISSHCLFIYLHMDIIEFSNIDYIFFASGWVLSIFTFGVFIMYGMMALKGYTIIEAAERYHMRREEVESFNRLYNNNQVMMIGNKKKIDNIKVIFNTNSYLLALLPLKRSLPNPSIYKI